MAIHKVLVFSMLALYIVYTSGDTITNGIVLDAEVEYQRDPWLQVKIKKSVNNYGSYNFKFLWNVHRDIANAKITLQSWPLLPYESLDGTTLNTTLVDDACSAIEEDFYEIFNKGFEKPCIKGKNIIRKGNYSFENNIDNAELFRQSDLGTMVYVLNVERGEAPYLRVRLLVDSNGYLRRKESAYKKTDMHGI